MIECGSASSVACRTKENMHNYKSRPETNEPAKYELVYRSCFRWPDKQSRE
jgi:hypothetical protein